MGRMAKSVFERLKANWTNNVWWQGRDSVLSFIAHAEAIELELKVAKEDEERAVKLADRLDDDNQRLIDNLAQLDKELRASRMTIAQLNSDNMTLTKLIDTHKAPEVVVVPQAVADALKFYDGRRSSTGIDILFNPAEIERLANMTAENTHAKTLNEYIFFKGYNTYFPMLINGYTVEKTKEERLRDSVKEIYYEWWSENNGEDEGSLFDNLTDFITKFHAEN